MSDAVVVEEHGPVRVLTLNRPHRRNALDLSDREALLTALVTAQEEARAVVLTGAPPLFSSGGDIRTMSSDPVAGRQRLKVVNALARQLVTGPAPVVAAVEGGAFGLGLGLACASDLTVAGRTARFAASFVKIGLAPDTGLSWTLPMRVGRAAARRMLLTAATVDADEALGTGLVDELTDDGGALDRALEIAGDLAKRSAPAIAATRGVLSQADQSLDGVLAAEAEAQLSLFPTAEFAEGREAFLEGRVPDFIAPQPASHVDHGEGS